MLRYYIDRSCASSFRNVNVTCKCNVTCRMCYCSLHLQAEPVKRLAGWMVSKMTCDVVNGTLNLTIINCCSWQAVGVMFVCICEVFDAMPHYVTLHFTYIFALSAFKLMLQQTTSIIFTDSLSALQSLESQKSQKLHQSLILSILTIIHHLHLKNYDVVFCWIPSHIGIIGNEKADQAAKSALNLPNITSYPLPYSDITCSIKKHLFTRWQPLA